MHSFWYSSAFLSTSQAFEIIVFPCVKLGYKCSKEDKLSTQSIHLSHSHFTYLHAYVLNELGFSFVCMLQIVIFHPRQIYIDSQIVSIYMRLYNRAMDRAIVFWARCGNCAANQISVFCS